MKNTDPPRNRARTNHPTEQGTESQPFIRRGKPEPRPRSPDAPPFLGKIDADESPGLPGTSQPPRLFLGDPFAAISCRMLGASPHQARGYTKRGLQTRTRRSYAAAVQVLLKTRQLRSSRTQEIEHRIPRPIEYPRGSHAGADCHRRQRPRFMTVAINERHARNRGMVAA